MARMGEIEAWYEYDAERTPMFYPGPFSSFLGAAFGDIEDNTSFMGAVAEDIATVVNAATQGAGNVITAYGDAKAGGGLSRTIGDTAVKIGVGVGVALAAYAFMRKGR